MLTLRLNAARSDIEITRPGLATVRMELDLAKPLDRKQAADLFNAALKHQSEAST